jgi:hypothetical protein
MLLAVLISKGNQSARTYTTHRLADEVDYAAVRAAQEAAALLPSGEVPEEPIPAGGGSDAGQAFSVQKYGMMKFGDLFTARQKLALTTLARNIRDAGVLGEEVREVMALLLNRSAAYGSSLCTLHSGREVVEPVFTRQALQPVWDFYETAPFGEGSGSYDEACDLVLRVAETLAACSLGHGAAQQADACQLPQPDGASGIWFTDPPYYDAVPYADLSDFFFVWLKRALPNHPLLRDPFDPQNPLTPKTREAVQDETKEAEGGPRDRAFFESTMGKAFAEGRRILNDNGIGCVVFAHKTTEGWEALLSGMIRGGWIITGSWPIGVGMGTRLRARESGLATSVYLVCRPRIAGFVGDWGEVLRELPGRVHAWMERLQEEGVRGADLVFACIGPALEIFSRHERVQAVEQRDVPLAEYLEKVWEVVGRSVLEKVLGAAEARGGNGTAGALEEDARLTALFLWALQSANGQNSIETDNEEEEEDEDGKKPKAGLRLVFDVARRLAQPLGIQLEDWQDQVIDIEEGVVRLLPVTERARQLFGKKGASAAASRLVKETQGDARMVLFPEREEATPRTKGRASGKAVSAESRARSAVTTLDRVHAAMLLQANGEANGLRVLIKAEQRSGPDFLRLANALSTLYPKGGEEKQLLDAVLLAVPR